MELEQAVGAFAALAQTTRLGVVRLLIEVAPNGVPAGEIATRVAVAPSTLSFHLAQLERAGLVRSWRRQRQVIYAADVDGMRRLVGFLVRDCCRGRPEICGDLARLAPACAIADPLIANGDGARVMADSERPPYTVLFVCSGNSARSIMAECALTRFGAGRFRAFSAGSMPKGAVDPTALALLASLNYRTDHLRSKDWVEFARPDSPPLDFVFTLCDRSADEVCPVWPGQPMTAHWGHQDPAAFDGPADKRLQLFKRIYFEIEGRIKVFSSLRFEGLDRLSLTRRLERIGQLAAADPLVEPA